jgi:hypothetical protein
MQRTVEFVREGDAPSDDGTSDEGGAGTTRRVSEVEELDSGLASATSDSSSSTSGESLVFDGSFFRQRYEGGPVYKRTEAEEVRDSIVKAAFATGQAERADQQRREQWQAAVGRTQGHLDRMMRQVIELTEEATGWNTGGRTQRQRELAAEVCPTGQPILQDTVTMNVEWCQRVEKEYWLRWQAQITQLQYEQMQAQAELATVIAGSQALTLDASEVAMIQLLADSNARLQQGIDQASRAVEETITAAQVAVAEAMQEAVLAVEAVQQTPQLALLPMDLAREANRHIQAHSLSVRQDEARTVVRDGPAGAGGPGGGPMVSDKHAGVGRAIPRSLNMSTGRVTEAVVMEVPQQYMGHQSGDVAGEALVDGCTVHRV